MDKKKEALNRMKKLGLMKEVIKAFEKGGDNSLYYSERINKMMPAVMYWVDNKPKYMEIVKEFEKKYNALVYHAILTHFEFGDLLDLLYVSNDRDEWEMDNEDIVDGYVIVNSVNVDVNDSKLDEEIGTIAVRPVMGGLERIG